MAVSMNGKCVLHERIVRLMAVGWTPVDMRSGLFPRVIMTKDEQALALVVQDGEIRTITIKGI